jgi:hypothetical protein
VSKKVCYIDGYDFTTLEGFFDLIRRVLIPDYDGDLNLNAFDDILYGGFGTPETGFALVWTNAEVSRKRLGYPETVRQLDLMLSRIRPARADTIVQDLEQAKRGEGHTVFDWLIRIIRSHGESATGRTDAVELVLA